MSLSCSWDYEWDGDGWYWIRREKVISKFHVAGKVVFDIEFFQQLWTKRSRKCKSCGTKINPGDTCVEFERYRGCRHDIEFRIYDETEGVPIASWFLCESCGEIHANLDALGYCVDIQENMPSLLAEYHHENGISAEV